MAKFRSCTKWATTASNDFTHRVTECNGDFSTMTTLHVAKRLTADDLLHSATDCLQSRGCPSHRWQASDFIVKKPTPIRLRIEWVALSPVLTAETAAHFNVISWTNSELIASRISSRFMLASVAAFLPPSTLSRMASSFAAWPSIWA